MLSLEHSIFKKKYGKNNREKNQNILSLNYLNNYFNETPSPYTDNTYFSNINVERRRLLKDNNLNDDIYMQTEHSFKPYNKYINRRMYGDWTRKTPYINDNKLIAINQEPPLKKINLRKIHDNIKIRGRTINWLPNNNNGVTENSILPYTESERQRLTHSETKKRINDAKYRYFDVNYPNMIRSRNHTINDKSLLDKMKIDLTRDIYTKEFKNKNYKNNVNFNKRKLDNEMEMDDVKENIIKKYHNKNKGNIYNTIKSTDLLKKQLNDMLFNNAFQDITPTRMIHTLENIKGRKKRMSEYFVENIKKQKYNYTNYKHKWTKSRGLMNEMESDVIKTYPEDLHEIKYHKPLDEIFIRHDIKRKGLIEIPNKVLSDIVDRTRRKKEYARKSNHKKLKRTDDIKINISEMKRMNRRKRNEMINYGNIRRNEDYKIEKKKIHKHIKYKLNHETLNNRAIQNKQSKHIPLYESRFSMFKKRNNIDNYDVRVDNLRFDKRGEVFSYNNDLKRPIKNSNLTFKAINNIPKYYETIGRNTDIRKNYLHDIGNTEKRRYPRKNLKFKGNIDNIPNHHFSNIRRHN